MRFIEQLESRMLLDAAAVEFRVNQVGYRPEEKKIILVGSTQDLDGQTVEVVDSDGSHKISVKIGRDRGVYGPWGHLYEVDVSELAESGRYRARLGAAESTGFTVGPNVYASLTPTTLEFFKVQRSGDTDPKDHGLSHLTDGTAHGGPMNGQHVDVTGGWYDAGDYLKFTLPSAMAAMLMLTAYDEHPDAFITDTKKTPAVLSEVRVELDWYTKMWDAKNQVLYYQVGNSKDHDDYGWRLPEGDDKQFPNRPVFACEKGKGANLAGKMSAALALGATLFGDHERPWNDDALAAKYADAAKSLYEWGKARPSSQSMTDGYYDEQSWQDDMALGGAELYRLTHDRSYLDDAEKWANQVGSQGSMDYGDLNALSCYEIARLDPSFKANAVAALKNDLRDFSIASDQSKWGLAFKKLDWGSGSQMNCAALEAMWYQNLSGDAQFRTMAIRQRDYLLGANPWGVCMVNGGGTVWPHHPHHPIADLKKIELTGFWAEGPVTQKTFKAEKIHLRGPDIYAAYQTGDAVYHDDTEDYTTNEPTLDMNASGLAMTAWFADSPGATTRPATQPTPQPATQAAVPSWNRINDFVYQLQNIDPVAIGRTKFDLAVIDYSADGSDAARFSKPQIESLQHSPGGPKRVLAYLSIGEAEDYRYYWQSSWKSSPPDFVGPVDPDWPGNYKVKYWDPAWQRIVFDYEDKIIDAGFDGVYLDVIDAYEFWRDKGHAGAEQEMVDFVKAIADHARETRGVKDFAVFVQNAAELSRHDDYLAAVTGIGQEDLFYNGNARQPADETNYIIPLLNKFKAAGKPVLVIDYPTQAAKIEDVYTRAHERGFIPYAPRRELDRLTINKGHEPD